MNKYLEIKGVSKTYKKTGQVILDNINLVIYEKEFIALTGESGSGKSTLLRMLGLIDHHFEGQYFYQGQQINQNNEADVNHFRKHALGIVFQDFNLIERYTIYRNLEFALIPQKIAFSKRSEMIEQALIKVNLDPNILTRYPQEVSGGQQQRIAIARALLTNATIIIADEPTGSLDEDNAQSILDLFKSLNLTLIIATHDKKLAKQADRHLHIRNKSVHVST